MNLWWKCPNCEEKVDYTEQMSSVFDESNEAEFDPEIGLFFHTIKCKCGATWRTGISEMEKD